MSEKTILILIPARGGSKGLPGKNLARVGGIPLVGRAARLGRRAARIFGPGCRVVCSTDSSAIAEAAKTWGAEVPFLRPAELASDDARTSDVLVHAIDTVGGTFDSVVVLQPTSPLTEIDDVLGAVALHRKCASPVVSVCAAEHPAEWLFTVDDGGRLRRLLERGDSVHQRQETIAAFRPNGAVFVSDPAAFRKERTFFISATRGFVMPAARSIDIDKSEDLDIASGLMALRETRSVRLSDRYVGSRNPCFVIAEANLSLNDGVDSARRLIGTVAAAGADAMSFPGLHAGAGDSQELAAHCRASGIAFLASPSREESVESLSGREATGFRLWSREVTNHEFLRRVARSGKPIILSTETSSLAELAAAVDVLEESGCQSLVLVESRGCEKIDAGLRTMKTIEMAFGWPVGYADPEARNALTIAAVAHGARVIEKRFTSARSIAAPDHDVSAESREFASLVRSIREVEAALRNDGGSTDTTRTCF
ncbi:MAG TPA: N-acetylneuraminate synthase family protein [Thermoanaerobaculia bacterium]|nr:N-acetylneuraminate synthase family protein [Thermoanaerobaculia bacterium]